MSSTDNWRDLYPTTESQLEFFLIKFHEVPRAAVELLRKQFDLFDGSHSGELEENEVAKLFEFRGQTITVSEMRLKISDIDADKNRRLAFLELCCSIFNKSWKKLHEPSGDPAEVERLASLVSQGHEYLQRASEKLEKLSKLSYEQQKEAKETEEQALRADEEKAHLEAELDAARHADEEKLKSEEEKKAAALGQKGVKGRSAHFMFAAMGTADMTKENRERIKRDADEKRRLKEVEVKAAKAKREADNASAALKKIEEEQAAEAAKKAEAEKNMAEAEKNRILAEKARAEKESYEAQKRLHEEEEQKKKDQAASKQAEARAKMASRANFFKQQAENAAK